MSQAGIINTQSGPPPPPVPTNFTTDVFNNDEANPNGTAIPALNNLEVLGRDTPQDNNFGIRTDADPNLGKFLYVELTNRVRGSLTTTDATPTPIITFPMPLDGTYIFELKVAAYNITDSLGAGFDLFGTTRLTGVNSFLVGTPDKVTNEEVGMAPCDVNLIVGGLGSNLVILNVTGIAGKTINWCAVGLYCTRGVT